jgi:uncharacterized protein with HEPN domain
LKPSDRDLILYLQDIVVSIERIQEYLSGLDFPRFEQDYKTVDAVIRNFEVIGEASKNLPKNFKDKYANVPWEEMYRLRNRISHEYFGIDYEIIWNIAKMQLPVNYEDILKILNIEKADRK